MSFEDLPAGPNSVLRVQAEVRGVAAPKMPAWEWTVRHQSTSQPIATTVVDMDRSIVEFPLAAPGNYDITARATANCLTQVTASATDHPVARLWLRVIPRTSLAQPVEGFRVDVPTGGTTDRDLPLEIGTPVSIDPRDASPLRQAVFSYVRITAPRLTLRVEGHTHTGPVTAHLDPEYTYDVLVVPDADLAMAPLLFRGRPSEINHNLFTIDPGISVGGQVSSSKGLAAGARVLLSDGPVPSTTGEVKVSGQYELRVRSGSRFAAVVIPPPDSGLPEARLPAGSGLAIYDFPPGPRVLDFAWSAIDSSILDLTVLDSAGAALSSRVRVRLSSEDGAFPDVGTLTLRVLSATEPEQRYSYHPSGFIQRVDSTDGRGFISFANLPRGKYSATLTPLDGSAAITTVPLDLSGAGARVTTSARLARKVSLSGKLLPAELTAGATLLALDAEADPSLPTPSAIVDAGGGYVLHLDPTRSYSLVLEAAPSNGLPRTFLPPIVAPAKDTVREAQTVGAGVPLSGRVTGAQGTVAGVLIEAYCVGQPPSCIDTSAPDTTNVRPVAETISDEDGNYRMLVPDPAIAN
jgi:hypothetical protein